MTRKSVLTEFAYVALGIYFFIFLITVAFQLMPETILTFQIAMALLLVSCLLHSVESLGLKTTAFFFIFSTIVGWGAEQLAISYGIIFPRYHYGVQLGYRIGDVPLIIPPSWFVFTYSAIMVAGLIAGKKRTSRIILLTILGGFIMACLDLALEPLALLRRYWMWDDSSHLIATQIRIFAGWIFWGCFAQLVMRLWGVPALSFREDRRHRVLPVFVLLGTGLYATWITTREWNPLFAFLTCSTLGVLIMLGFFRVLSEEAV